MLPREFYQANYERIQAEDGRQDLIDHVVDAIGYHGERRRRFLQQMETAPFTRLVETVYRYWRRGKATLPPGWYAETTDKAERAADAGPPADVRNLSERYRLTFARRRGKITVVKRPVTVYVSTQYAQRARECRDEHGGDCNGYRCRRLTLTGYCMKWGLYMAQRKQVEATAAAF